MSVVIDGNLGITTPAETVQGALTTTGNTILGDATTDTLNVGNGGLVKDASGNVGIGTASPTRLLDVSNTAGDATVAITSSTTGQSSVWFADTDTNIGGLYYEHTNNAMGFRTNDVERMRIDSSGNVGIGTASPTNKLDVSGDIRAINNSFIKLGYTGYEATLQYTSDGNLTITPRSGYNTVFATGNLLFNSGYGSAATAYGCRAWVNFNGTGTVAIRASGNVSSITDNGTGNYTVNFTTNMPDINYAALKWDSGYGSGWTDSPLTVTGFILKTSNSTNAVLIDVGIVMAAVFR